MNRTRQNRGQRPKRTKTQMTNKMKRKLALLFTIIVLALIGLNIRLAYINRTNGDKYTKKVLAQQDTDSTLLPYKRGDILDRNGTVLATSEKVYNLILDAKVLLQNASDDADKDCVQPTIQALVSCFGLEEADLRTALTEKSGSSYIQLLKQLTKDEIAEFEAMQKDQETGAKIKGVWFEDSYVRKYPYDSLACNVIGYTVSGNQGQTGIEEEYSSTLNGIDGRSYNYLNEDLEQENVSRAATDGYSLVSTLDVTLQGITEKYIAKFEADYANAFREGAGAKNIGVIMMNPQNGEILAMAGDVAYDLNDPYDLVGSGYCTQEEADAMTEEEKLDAMNQMWRNFCISDGFEPGSTVKPMTIAGALEDGVLSGSETFLCDGSQTVADHRISCAKKTGHGIITLEGALMFSCNDALMQIAAMQGIDELLKYQNIFNFGLKTNIDLPGETNNSLSVFTGETMGPTELATSSFGQGYNTTMIQVATAFSSVINGGYYYQPHVAKKIVDSNGGIVKNISTTLMKQTISAKTSSTVKQYLYNTMYGETDANGNSATGKKARVAGYAMGGKTGTAEKLPRKSGNYLVSFIGFAPVDDPQVVCYVVVDEPNAELQASSSFAQEIFKNIMKEAMPYLNIYATESVPADMQEEVDAENAAAQEQAAESETEGETEEAPLPEGTLIDPQTGEAVEMPTEEDTSNSIMGDTPSTLLEGIISTE